MSINPSLLLNNASSGDSSLVKSNVAVFLQDVDWCIRMDDEDSKNVLKIIYERAKKDLTISKDYTKLLTLVDRYINVPIPENREVREQIFNVLNQ